MEFEDYQDKVVATCPASNINFAYMLFGLNAEVGKLNDKVEEWISSGVATIVNNHLVFNTSDVKVRDVYLAELKKNLGRCLWFTAGLASDMWCELNDIAWYSLEVRSEREVECKEREHEILLYDEPTK